MTLYLSNRDGNGKTSEEGHYRFQTQLWSGDIIPGSGDELIVTQNSPIGMQVLIGTGDFKIDTGYGYSYTGWNSNSLSVQVSTADPANPRISSIVLYVDKGEVTSPSPPNNPGIIKAKSVNGTPAALPAPPSLSTIQSQVGPSNPYIILANVMVNAGSSQIVDSNITDDRKFVSILSGGIGNLSIEERMLGTDSVTADKIKNGEVNDAKWRNGIAFYTRRVSSRAFAAQTFTKLSCDTIVYNIGGGYSNSSDIGRFTAPVKGIYTFYSSINAAASNNTRVILELRHNGSTANARVSDITGTSIKTVNGSTFVNMNAGDYVEAFGWTQVATNIASSGSSATEFGGSLVTRV